MFGSAAQLYTNSAGADEAAGLRDAGFRVAARAASLTGAERDILLSVTSGLTGKEISRSRPTSLLTVRTQIKSIKSKLGTRSIAQSVAGVMACKRANCPQRE